MTGDYRRLEPRIDEHTRMVIDEATEVLGFLRGGRGTSYLDNPAVRLHLLESLHQQLCDDLPAAVRHLNDHAHS